MKGLRVFTWCLCPLCEDLLLPLSPFVANNQEHNDFYDQDDCQNDPPNFIEIHFAIFKVENLSLLFLIV